LALVSTFGGDRFDAATDSIRALWPGAIRLDTVPASGSTGSPTEAQVDWPEDGHASGTVARARVDTVGAVVAGAIVVVAPFERRWRFDSSALAGARVVARWVDGEPAGIERGCVRAISVAAPAGAGAEIASRAAYSRFSRAMRGRCGGAGGSGLAASRADSSAVAALGGHGPMRVPARAVVAAGDPPAPLVPWLLAAALVLAIAEIWVRRRG
jgi:hypothetical protein